MSRATRGRPSGPEGSPGSLCEICLAPRFLALRREWIGDGDIAPDRYRFECARSFFVYILASRFKTLYVGVTNDLDRRLAEHAGRRAGSYTARYRIHRLVHFEVYATPSAAIAREKELKGWRRDRKVDLIESSNPGWSDLREDR